jgi:hypothetical protein
MAARALSPPPAQPEAVRLDLEMSLGVRDPHDLVEINGSPPIRAVIQGGIQGDAATAAIIANCIPAIARSRLTGLLSMRELPALPYFRPRFQQRDDG